jgi:branched-chain amino acid transport system substrate-binding protein
MKKLIIPVIGLAMFGLLFNFGCNSVKTNADLIKIGIVVPLSGNGAVIGNYSKEGAQMAIDEINASGGLLGKKIGIEVQDSKSDPKEGVNIIKNIVNEKQKPFMIYSIISGVTMAMRPETEKNKMILLAAIGSNKFIPNSKYTIRNYVSGKIIGEKIVPFIKDSLRIKSLSIFYANNEYSTSVKNGVEKSCKDAGLKIQFTEPFDEKLPDYKSLVAASINNHTECIFIDGIGNGMGSMIKQIRESGYKGLIVSDPIIKFPDVMTSAGSAIKGVYYLDYTYDENSSDPKMKAFTDSYKARFKSIPANFAVISYVGMKMLLEKINEIRTMDCDKIIEAMNSVKNYPGVFGPISVENREMQFTYTYKRF